MSSHSYLNIVHMLGKGAKVSYPATKHSAGRTLAEGKDAPKVPMLKVDCLADPTFARLTNKNTAW